MSNEFLGQRLVSLDSVVKKCCPKKIAKNTIAYITLDSWDSFFI